MLEQLYRHRVTRGLIWLLTRPAVSRAAGAFMDSRASKILIKPFISINGVKLDDILVQDYVSFNAFFTRELKPGARVIDAAPEALVSPCDGLLSVYPVTREGAFVVKGTPYTLAALVGDGALAEAFVGGWCLSFRLTSADYHHYVFPDDGEFVRGARIPGVFHTVRPYALGEYPVYKTNTREYALVNTAHFGGMLIIEVGAMLVGRIVNISGVGKFKRGDKKGRFEFGGSTILVIAKAGVLKPRGELILNTEAGRETRVKLGERVGAANFE